MAVSQSLTWKNSLHTARVRADDRFALQVADLKAEREAKQNARMDLMGALKPGALVYVLTRKRALATVERRWNTYFYSLADFDGTFRRDQLLLLPCQPTEWSRRWFAMVSQIKAVRLTPDKLPQSPEVIPLKYYPDIPIHIANRDHIAGLVNHGLLRGVAILRGVEHKTAKRIQRQRYTLERKAA